MRNDKAELKIFYGIDGTRGMPKWWRGDPYIISASALWNKKRKRFRVLRAKPKGEFFLDSGGFSFFHKEGEYPFSPDEYLEYVKVLKPHYFATMDYPCEPNVNRQVLKTNLERIEATVDFGVYLWKKRHEVDSKPIVVVQGYTLEEYAYCYELYRKKGIKADYYAFGSMCRRWRDREIREYIRTFRRMLGNEVKIHIFGIKVSALNCEVINLIDSIDTMAWCYSRFKGGYGCTEENFLAYKSKLTAKIESCFPSQQVKKERKYEQLEICFP